jgi:hypothetical protein
MCQWPIVSYLSVSIRWIRADCQYDDVSWWLYGLTLDENYRLLLASLVLKLNFKLLDVCIIWMTLTRAGVLSTECTIHGTLEIAQKLLCFKH